MARDDGLNPRGMDALVTTEWLGRELGAADLRVLDASVHSLEPERDPRAEFERGHIPGAQFMDVAALADPDSALPGMLPSAGLFAARMGALGVRRDDRIVLYDLSSHRTSARAWWMLRMFGARHVALLDGGLAAWRTEGRAIETGAAEMPATARFEPGAALSQVRDLKQMTANQASGAEIVVDARSPARFSGREADPRAGVAPGHIPGSYNLRCADLLHEDGTWKRGPAVRAAFAEAGVDLDRALAVTCGSGVTAAVLLFAAHLIGKDDVALYDGSWSEWGADAATAKATGA